MPPVNPQLTEEPLGGVPQGVSTYEEPTPADLGYWYGSPYVQPEAVADDPYFDPTVNPGSAYLADPAENRWADSGEGGYGRLRHQFTTPPGTPIPFTKGPTVPWQSMGQPAPSDQWISGAPIEGQTGSVNWDRWRPPSEQEVLLEEMPDDYIDKAFHPGNPQWEFVNDPFLNWDKLLDEGSGVNIRIGMRDPGKGPYDIKEGSDLFRDVTTKTPADNPSTLEQWMGMRFTDAEKNKIRNGEFWKTPKVIEWAKGHLDRLGEAGTAVRKGIIGETTGDIEGAKGLGAFTRNLGENIVGLSDELGKLIEVEGGRASIKGFTPKNPTLTGLLQLATGKGLSEIDKQQYGDLQPGALIVLGAYAGTPAGQAIFGVQVANQLKDFVQQVFNVSTFKKADYSGGLFSDVTEFTGSLIRPISRLVLNQILKRIKSDLPDDASMQTVFQELMSKDQVEDPRAVLDEQSTLAITPDPRFKEVGNIDPLSMIPALPLLGKTNVKGQETGSLGAGAVGAGADVVDVDFQQQPPPEVADRDPATSPKPGQAGVPLPTDMDVKQLSTEEIAKLLEGDREPTPPWAKGLPIDDTYKGPQQADSQEPQDWGGGTLGAGGEPQEGVWTIAGQPPSGVEDLDPKSLSTEEIVNELGQPEVTQPPNVRMPALPDPTQGGVSDWGGGVLPSGEPTVEVENHLGGFPPYKGPKPPVPKTTVGSTAKGGDVDEKGKDLEKGDELGGKLEFDPKDIPEKETVTLTEWTISDEGMPQKTGNTYTIDRHIVNGSVDTDAQGNQTVRWTYEPLEDSLKRPLDSKGKPILMDGKEVGFQLGSYVKPGEQPKGSQRTYVTSEEDLRNSFEQFKPKQLNPAEIKAKFEERTVDELTNTLNDNRITQAGPEWVADFIKKIQGMDGRDLGLGHKDISFTEAAAAVLAFGNKSKGEENQIKFPSINVGDLAVGNLDNWNTFASSGLPSDLVTFSRDFQQELAESDIFIGGGGKYDLDLSLSTDDLNLDTSKIKPPPPPGP